MGKTKSEDDVAVMDIHQIPVSLPKKKSHKVSQERTVRQNVFLKTDRTIQVNIGDKKTGENEDKETF